MRLFKREDVSSDPSDLFTRGCSSYSLEGAG